MPGIIVMNILQWFSNVLAEIQRARHERQARHLEHLRQQPEYALGRAAANTDMDRYSPPFRPDSITIARLMREVNDHDEAFRLGYHEGLAARLNGAPAHAVDGDRKVVPIR